MMIKKLLPLAFLALTVSAVAQTYTPKDYPNVRVEKDLRYGPRRALPEEGFAYKSGVLQTNEWGFAKNGHSTGQDYDLYYPADARPGLPVFVYIHGGAWSWPYDKTDHEEFFELIANDGWAVFAPDYVLQNDYYNDPKAVARPNATFDDMMRDIDLFMAEVKRVASARGFDARRIVISGESAGGHLCSLYAYDAVVPERLGLGLKHPLEIGLVFDIVGAVDFTDPNWLPTGIRTMNNDRTRYMNWMAALMGKSDAATLEKYSTVPMIRKGVPEHLLSFSQRTGAQDDGIIPVSNFIRLTNALARCEVPVSARLFEGTSHCETMQPAATEAREWYLNELRRYRASLGFLKVPAITAEIDGRTVEAYPVRLSAAPINKIFDGRQRDLSQTKAGAVLSFDFARPCEFKIKFAEGFPEDLEIRPLSRANAWRRTAKDTVVVQLLKPEQFVLVSRAGLMPDIHVFANEPFVAPEGPNVRRFKKGVHRPGLLAPKSGETIVIDEGAVVHAECFVLGATNVTITGRGVLDFSEWDRYDSRAVDFRLASGLKKEDTELACNPFVVHSSEHVRISGITLKDAPFWTLIVRNGSTDVEIDNVKIVGNWRYNSDGINICASERVTVRNCFVRSFDDCLVARASYFDRDDGIPTRRLRFEDNRLWCDWGKNCEVWAGHKPTIMEDIIFRRNAFLNVHFMGCDVTTWFCSDATFIGDIVFDGNEYDLGENRPATQFQSHDHELYRFSPMREASLFEISSWHPAKNLGNQHFGPPDDVALYNLVFDNVRFSDPRIYGGTDQTLVIKGETSTPYQHIRNVTCVDVPDGVRLETKGDVQIGVEKSRAGKLAALWDSADRHHVFAASHRTDWRHYPENTVPAALSAIAMGVDVLEIDLKRTKDGVLVLSHDKKVDRCTDGKGLIADLTLDEIRKLRLKEGQGRPGAALTSERMAVFSEYLQAVKGKALVNIDQADWLDFRDIVATVEKYGSLRETIFKGGLDPETLRKMLGEHYWQMVVSGEIRYMPIIRFDRPDQMDLFRKWQALDFAPTAYEIVLGPKGTPVPADYDLDPRAPNAPRVWINTLWDSLADGHTDDLSVTRPRDGWDWAIRSGATAIQTDRPAMLKARLKAFGRATENLTR